MDAEEVERWIERLGALESDLDYVAPSDMIEHDRFYEAVYSAGKTLEGKTWGCVMVGRPRKP